MPEDVVQAAPGLSTGVSLFESNTAADLLLESLRERDWTIGELAGRLRDAFEIDEEQATVDVARFVRSANAAGLISVNAPLRTEIYFSGIRRLEDLWVAQYAGSAAMQRGPRRIFREPSPGNLLGLIVSVHLRISLLLLGPSALFHFFPPEIAATDVLEWYMFLFIFCSMVLIFGVLTFIHEGLHMMMARATGVPGIAVYRSGLVVGFQRARTTPGREMAISVTGPLGAAAAGIGMSVAVVAWGADLLSPIGLPHRLMLFVLLIAVVYHLIALTPIAQDGRVIRRTMRTLKGVAES